MTSSSRILAIAFELIAVSAALTGASRPDSLLDRLAQTTSRFWDQFSSVTCTEVVDQKKLQANGKTIVDKKSTYDYLILLQLTGDELTVEESRIRHGKEPREGDRSLLSTHGFSTLVLIFHPLFQPSYEFEDGGEAEWNGRRCRKLHFQHVPGRRSPSVLQLHNRDYPIEWRGTAWIDMESASVARIEADLKSPMPDIGLIRLASDVQYVPVAISGADTGLWAPRSAVVEAATRRQRWQNTHTFSKYRQFQVNTETTTENPKEQ